MGVVEVSARVLGLFGRSSWLVPVVAVPIAPTRF